MTEILTLPQSADKIRVLMSADPSQLLDPLRLARAGKRIMGKFPVRDLSRIQDRLLVNEGDVSYSLRFSLDELNLCLCLIDIEINGKITLACQRCMGPFELECGKSSLIAVLTAKDGIDILPREYEPIVLDEQAITIQGLIEDELLLAIPLLAAHPVPVCSGTEKIERINAEGRVSPFAALSVFQRKAQ